MQREQSKKKVCLSLCNRPWLYSRGHLIYMLYLAQLTTRFTLNFQLRPINGTVAVFSPLVFKSVEPFFVLFCFFRKYHQLVLTTKKNSQQAYFFRCKGKLKQTLFVLIFVCALYSPFLFQVSLLSSF